MSILIKGMEMPRDCDSCILKAVSMGGWVCVPTKRLAAEEAYEPNPFKERPDWCPLVELPPHGDLIDRSKLAWTPIDITDLPFGECLPVYLKEDVDSAPIVVESEET